MAKIMTSTFLIRNDYLNEYIGLLGFLSNIPDSQPKVRKFSERYANQNFLSIPRDEQAIKVLDELAEKVNSISSQEIPDRTDLERIMYSAVEICQGKEEVERWKKIKADWTQATAKV